MESEVRVYSIAMGMAPGYLLEVEGGLVLVDAGSPGHEDKVLGLMAQLGRDDLRLVFITHAHLDHYGSASAIRRETGAQVAVHEADAESMARGETLLGTARGRGRILPPLMNIVERFIIPDPTPADLVFTDGQDLGDYLSDGWVLHTPGHTLGSSSLMIGDRLAFVGDLITNRGTPKLQRFYAQDWGAIPRSLERLQKANPALVYPGHGRKSVSSAQLHLLSST